MKNILNVTCCIMLSGFKPLDSKLIRQIREQTKFQGVLNPDCTASVVGETKQVKQAGKFQGLYREHDLHGRFGLVLVFLPVKVTVPNKI